MTSFRQCTMNDLFYFNNVNLDVLTETYNLQFYMQYMTYWPESFIVAKTTTTTTATTGTRTGTRTHYTKNVTGSDATQNSTNSTNTVDAARTELNRTVTNKNFDRTTDVPLPIIMGYLLGKSEGEGRLWHGHVSAITISQYYRRISVAKYLMQQFETTICTDQKRNFFVDLFVRASNTLAIQMYHSFGYRTYRRVIGYYQSSSSSNSSTSGTDINPSPEDAYDMRKSLPRDPQQLLMIPLPHPVYPEDLEW